MLDKDVRGQLALLWSFFPEADDTDCCVGRFIGASRSGALLQVTETAFPQLSRSDRTAGIFQRDDSRR